MIHFFLFLISSKIDKFSGFDQLLELLFEFLFDSAAQQIFVGVQKVVSYQSEDLVGHISNQASA